jgi:hypothetical protein
MSHNIISKDLLVFPDSTFTDESIRVAVDEWLANETEAAQLYGPIASWNTGNVTDMSKCECRTQELFLALLKRECRCGERGALCLRVACYVLWRDSPGLLLFVCLGSVPFRS